MIQNLRASNFTEIEKLFKSLFASISYTYSQQVKNYDVFYGSVVYAFFKGIGLECIAEDHTNIGRIDLALKLKGEKFIFLNSKWFNITKVY